MGKEEEVNFVKQFMCFRRGGPKAFVLDKPSTNQATPKTLHSTSAPFQKPKASTIKTIMVCEKEAVTPGEIIGDATQFIAGKGAYISPNGRNVISSLTGRLKFTERQHESTNKAVVEVVGHKAHGAVPEPGSVVIARVTKVMAKVASADIMCVGSKAVREKFSGTIRQQDVRATEIDKVDMYQSFLPGDIVRALVLSLGDARAYYLSTAKNELGVLSAQSKAGATMVPISWTEMQCPLTGQTELRKVAKVD